MQGSVPLAAAVISRGGVERRAGRPLPRQPSRDMAMLHAFPPERSSAEEGREQEQERGFVCVWEALATLTPPREGAKEEGYHQPPLGKWQGPGGRYFDQGHECAVDECGATLRRTGASDAIPPISSPAAPRSPPPTAPSKWPQLWLDLRAVLEGSPAERALLSDLREVYYSCSDELTALDCRSLLLSLYRALNGGADMTPREAAAVLDTIRVLEDFLKRMTPPSRDGARGCNVSAAPEEAYAEPDEYSDMQFVTDEACLSDAASLRERWRLFEGADRSRQPRPAVATVSPLQGLSEGDASVPSSHPLWPAGEHADPDCLDISSFL